MKQTTVGAFEAREDAEKAIYHAHRELSIPNDDISFLYRDADGELREVDTTDVSGSTAGEGAKRGAMAGALIGLLLALASVFGLATYTDQLMALPILNEIATISDQALAVIGIGGAIAGAVALMLAGALIGALLGALMAGSSSSVARRYDDRARVGQILVAVNAPERYDVYSLFRRLGSIDTKVYRLSV